MADKESRILGVRVAEAELAALNANLAKMGFASLSDMVHGVANGLVSNSTLVGDLAEQIASKVVQQMYNKNTTGQIADLDANRAVLSVKTAGLWGFGPQTPGLKVSPISCAFSFFP